MKIDVFHFTLMHRPVICHKITHQANGRWILTCIFVLFSILDLWFLSPISLISPSPPSKSPCSSCSACLCCCASESLPWLGSKGSAPSGSACRILQTSLQDLQALTAGSTAQPICRECTEITWALTQPAPTHTCTNLLPCSLLPLSTDSPVASLSNQCSQAIIGLIWTVFVSFRAPRHIRQMQGYRMASARWMSSTELWCYINVSN